MKDPEFEVPKIVRWYEQERRYNSRRQDAELPDAGVLPHGMTQRQHVAAVLLSYHLVAGREVVDLELMRGGAGIGQLPAAHHLHNLVVKYNPVAVLRTRTQLYQSVPHWPRHLHVWLARFWNICQKLRGIRVCVCVCADEHDVFVLFL